MVWIFSFSDYLFGALIVLMVVSNNFQLKSKQYKWILIVIGTVVLNILQNYLINNGFIIKLGLASLFKISLYTIVSFSFYNFITRINLEKKLINSLNLATFIVCMIGFYILIALYTNGILPYEFLWNYTRTDAISYLFEGGNNLYRIRSIFSEPSYLGNYLLIILGINLFNKKNIKVNLYFILFLILTIIFTFSYSAISIMVLILIIHSISSNAYKKIRLKEYNLLYILITLSILLVFIYFNKDIIQVTIIERTTEILAGKDSSASSRLLESWQHINKEHLIAGNGIGHTPDIWNIYAYFLSDLGVLAFVGLIILSIYLVSLNYGLGILFIALNFQKGGYLAVPFYIFIVMIFIFNYKKKGSRL
ncbi:hypothetical protein ACEN4M_00035 [Marinilactibacillus psychrotolerans]